MVANGNDAANERFRALIVWETDGERSPPQPDIQIRVDFERRGFCLVANGEPNGKLYSQHKRAALDRAWVLAQLAAGGV